MKKILTLWLVLILGCGGSESPTGPPLEQETHTEADATADNPDADSEERPNWEGPEGFECTPGEWKCEYTVGSVCLEGFWKTWIVCTEANEKCFFDEDTNQAACCDPAFPENPVHPERYCGEDEEGNLTLVLVNNSCGEIKILEECPVQCAWYLDMSGIGCVE